MHSLLIEPIARPALHAKGMAKAESSKLSPFGRRLRTLIRRAGFRSRAEFCEASGISAMTLYRWETGLHLPQMPNLRALASALRVSTEELAGTDSLAAVPTSPYASLAGWLDASDVARQLRGGVIISADVSARALDLLTGYRGTLGDPGLGAWDALARRAVEQATEEARPATNVSPIARRGPRR